MSSNYGSFNVSIFKDSDGSLTPIAGKTIKAYNADTNTDLGSIGSTDSSGNIPAGTLSVAVGTHVNFRLEDDGHGRKGWAQQVTVSGTASPGMNIVVRPSRGLNLIFRPEALPISLPTPTINAAGVIVGVRIDGDPTHAVKEYGPYSINTEITINNFWAKDQTIWVGFNPINAFGIRKYSSWADVTFNGPYAQNRENNTPTIAQLGASSDLSITLKVGGFGPYTVARQVISADDAGFTTNLTTTYRDLLAGISDPTYEFVTRHSDTGLQTRHVKVAHSSAGINGPWSPFSTPISVEFSSGGSGGSSGGSDPGPPDKQPADLIT